MAGDLIMLLGSGEALRAENWQTEKLVFSPFFRFLEKILEEKFMRIFSIAGCKTSGGVFFFSVNLRRDLDGGQKKAWLFWGSMEGGARIFLCFAWLEIQHFHVLIVI